MRSGLHRPGATGLVGSLDGLRGLLAGSEPPPGGWPSALRDALGPIQSDEGDDDPAVVEALRRLVLMAEVWDCLDSEGPDTSDMLPTFFAEAIDRLVVGLRRDEPGGATAWILRESEAQWGDYLALIDPLMGAIGDAADPATTAGDPPWADDGPAIDAAELLRRLAGETGPGASEAPSPLGDPAGLPFGSILEAWAATSPPTTAPRPSGSDPLAQARTIGIDAELRSIFVADVSELFGKIQGLVLGLGGPGDVGRLLELGRCYHTLKGAAGSVGLTGLAAAIHDLEDELEAAGGTSSEGLARRLEGSLSLLEGILGVLGDAGPTGVAPSGHEEPPSTGVGVPGAPVEGGGAIAGPRASEGDGLIRMPASRFEELMDLCSELLTKRRAWADQAERMKTLAHSTRLCSHRLRGSIDRLGEAAPLGGRIEEPRRERGCDDPAGMIRRMIEQAEDLAALAVTAREAAIPMMTEAEDLARLSLRLWDGLQSVRIVPVLGLFQRLVRVARDAARVEGRSIEVRLVGEETGADRLLLDRAYEPLLHIIRNAVGHGIEAPEDRERAGKPAAGRITLEARRECNTFVLEVQDDGRGLDYDAIAAKGRRLGLLGPEERPSLDRLNGLIFQAGFSTRSHANAVSGRGVGMDVVAREVELLRGRIELSSEAGLGTRLAIRLPARIALEHTMVVRIRGQAFAVPISAIDAVHRATLAEPEGHDPGPIVAIGGRRLPMIDVGTVLGFSGPSRESCPTVLVVTSDTETVALRVDGIDGPLELVLKPLGPLLAGHPAISGAGLSTDGEVIPAIDIAGLLQLARAGEPPTADPVDPGGRRPDALVVDDSLSVRRVATRHLRALGFDVDEASDGEEALGRLRLRPYRLIVTDLEMPRMDGFALLAELGRSGALETTHVVVTSTLTDAATRRRVLDLGAMAFVPKPMDAEVLALAVGPLLDRNIRIEPDPEPSGEPSSTRPT